MSRGTWPWPDDDPSSKALQARFPDVERELATIRGELERLGPIAKGLLLERDTARAERDEVRAKNAILLKGVGDLSTKLAAAERALFMEKPVMLNPLVLMENEALRTKLVDAERTRDFLRADRDEIQKNAAVVGHKLALAIAALEKIEDNVCDCCAYSEATAALEKVRS